MIVKERLAKEPITIGVLGPIGSGKSTLCRILSERLNVERIEENFSENPFLKDFYKNPQQFSFRSQLWFLKSTVDQLMEIRENRTRILDPANEMNFLYAETHRRLGWMSKHEFEIYNKLYVVLTEKSGIKTPDLYLCINAKLSVLQERIIKRGRPFELTMLKNHPHYLSNLSAEVDAFRAGNFLQIDTTHDNSIDETHIDGLMERIKRNI
ncbi:MAG: Deoxynucleoside kinase [Candidatus Woesebacteria bacterium GW2011_GWB1_45_5]|uniref:Deoxynucleoside kinase n=1 Tax=Candidatus Woesebacteria bacterium GW2011_GWB1_45_5 TaxID=1618581 RepID=A0A0G1MP77_9BACT|nr:MAG: Deoxynucleoside kinase [Candidatus Woesebacteria bacterium GW2011_GWB1_45_5]